MRDAAMKALKACLGEETHTVWTATLKRLIHRYLEDRNTRRAFRGGGAEDRIVALYEGRSWCDATERELIGDITNIYGSHLWGSQASFEHAHCERPGSHEKKSPE
jgi:hypothetical protein